MPSVANGRNTFGGCSFVSQCCFAMFRLGWHPCTSRTFVLSPTGHLFGGHAMNPGTHRVYVFFWPRA